MVKTLEVTFIRAIQFLNKEINIRYIARRFAVFIFKGDNY